MTDTNSWTTNQESWARFAEELNESLLESLDRNVDAHAMFVESWLNALELDPFANDVEMSDHLDAFIRAYEVWMGAAEQQFIRMSDAVEGEDVPLDEFRDLWLNTANEAFKEIMSTSAFAESTGQSVESVLEIQQQIDDVAETALHNLGFSTKGDITEVGNRLVELERRNFSLEQQISTLIESRASHQASIDDRIDEILNQVSEIDELRDVHAEGLKHQMDVKETLDEVIDSVDRLNDRIDDIEAAIDQTEE